MNEISKNGLLGFWEGDDHLIRSLKEKLYLNSDISITKFVLFLVLVPLLASTITIDYFSDAEALKSKGTRTAQYGSSTGVCGLQLCSEIPGGKDAWKQGLASIQEPELEPEIEQEESSEELPFEIPPPIITQLSDNIYHYFGGSYSSLIVISDTDVLITDVANAMRGEMLKEEIAKITDVSVTKIVLTHEHYDHAGGTQVFENAKIICQSNCQDMFDLDPFNVTPEKVDTEFDDFLSIDIGETTVELHYLGPGDGEATTIIYLPEEQIIVSADMYEPSALTPSMWVDDKNPVGVRHILNTVKDWPIKHAINAHSPGTNPIDLYDNAEYQNALYDAVYSELTRAIEEGGPFAMYLIMDTLHESIHLEEYSDWDGYDEHFPRHVQRMALGITHGD